MSSLDPRIKRLDLKKVEEGEVHTNSHLVTWEVFHQDKRGKQVGHVGIVHASSPEMALVVAKEVFGRRGKTTNIWVTKTSDVYTFPMEDEDIFERDLGGLGGQPSDQDHASCEGSLGLSSKGSGGWKGLA